MRRSTPKDRVDPAEALMREVGAQLQKARLERGEDLDTVAQYLRISPAYLAGIEEGDLSTLPGRTYALGFLRSYADHLGLDGQDLVTQIKSAVGNLTRKQRLRIHTPMPESRLPKTPILAISLVLILAVYGAWSYVGGSGERVAETVSEVPDELREVAIDALAPPPERIVPNAPQSRAGPADDVGTGALASAPHMVDAPEEQAFEPGAGPAGGEVGAAAALASDDGRRDAPPSAREPADPAAAALPAGASDGMPPDAAQVEAALQESAGGGAEIAAPEDTAARVVLRALGTTWVHVSSATGDYRYVQTLEPGDTLLVPDRPDLSLWTGNAGGLEIVVDGRTLPPLGPDGEVVRDVPLDPESLLAHLQTRAR
jgi:cytoskeleton protein RodZ